MIMPRELLPAAKAKSTNTDIPAADGLTAAVILPMVNTAHTAGTVHTAGIAVPADTTLMAITRVMARMIIPIMLKVTAVLPTMQELLPNNFSSATNL